MLSVVLWEVNAVLAVLLLFHGHEISNAGKQGWRSEDEGYIEWVMNEV